MGGLESKQGCSETGGAGGNVRGQRIRTRTDLIQQGVGNNMKRPWFVNMGVYVCEFSLWNAISP